VDELSVVLTNNDIDICGVVETWLKPNIPTESLDIDGYVLHRRDRSDGRECGGVAAYVRNNLQCVRLNDLETPLLETLWLLYRCNRMPRSVSHLLIGIIYHPPDAINRIMTNHLLESIDNVVRCHPSAGVMLIGDFNRMYDSALREYPMKQTVKSATRNTALLDKIYTNIADWYLPPVILPEIGGSDHRTVLSLPVHSNVRRGSKVTAVVRSSDQNAKNLFARALNSVNWLPLYKMNDVDLMITYFYSTVTALIDEYLPERIVVRHTSNKPWVTEEFIRLIRQRQHAWTTGNITRFKSLRNRVNRLSHTLRQRFCKRRIQSLRRCNASNWWRETKKLTGQSSKSDLSGLADMNCEGDIQQLTNIINQSLQSVSADLQPLTANTFTAVDQVPSQYTIYPEEIFSKLQRINTRKAPGPDNLPNWILKEFAFILSDPLCCVFNTSIQQGRVPSLWRKANVVPIPKARPPCSVENDLRPISLTPTLSKLLESFVGQWMLESISNKFDPKQFGGLKGRSTTHALVDILHLWNAALDVGESIRVVFVDYAKAFEHVDHSIVLRKMTDMGTPAFIVQWMHSFLSDRRQRVKIGTCFSDWLQLNGSMPQGTWLGLYIFLILINDLTSTVQLHKYVDDVTMTERVRRDESSNMQQELDELQLWSNANLMKINSKKTKEMLLGPIGRNQQPPALHLAGHQLERVTSFKLLGVIISDTLKWDDYITSICSKAAKRLHFLKLLKRSGIATDDLLYYYTSVVLPVLEYGSIIWHANITEEQIHQLESIQRRAVRIIDPGESDKKLQPLVERREVLSKRFFNSLMQPSNCLHNILPAPRNRITTEKLRHANNYPTPFAKTERFKRSFIVHAMANYQ